MPVGRLENTVGTRRQSATALTAAGWTVGVLCTVAILESPYLRFGYRSPELHLVLDSVDACVALLLAYLLAGRLRRTQRWRDLLLVAGLGVLGVVGLGTALTAHLLPETTRSTIGVWLPAVLRVGAALLIAAAAAAGDRGLTRRQVRWGLAAPLAAVLFAAALLWVGRDNLPTAVIESDHRASDQPDIAGHVGLILAQALSALCFLFASLRFARQARDTGEQLLTWLGPGCALLGFARVNYLLFPSLYSGWLYTGDLLRTAGYACLLVGAAREIGRYWATRADVAVVEDRRRLARELHDGVVQELSWIKSEARSLSHQLPYDAAPLGSTTVQSILDASDRALDEARAAVDALGRGPDEPLGYALHRSARDVADRHGGRVVVELDDSVQADQARRHHLARITREAVGNALRHGRATCVRISLEATPTGGRLVVQDDGDGFDVAAVAEAAGYGLTSMRARALALPGTFDLRSAPGVGTRVEVSW